MTSIFGLIAFFSIGYLVLSFLQDLGIKKILYVLLTVAVFVAMIALAAYTITHP
jgi:hypothetical protein